MTPTTLPALADRYEAFLIDQFGVILGGNGPYPGSVEALGYLQNLGKPVLVLSNSGKRAETNAARLEALGVSRGLYSAIVTSGEVAFDLLGNMIGREIPRGAPTLVLSRDDTEDYLAGLDLTRTSHSDRAEVVLIAGSKGDLTDLATYRDMLQPAAQRRVPCFCTNPDMTMLTSQGTAFAAGRIAQTYEELGGEVTYIGKPHPAIYTAARARLGGIPASDILCIGDSPAHDIAGGKASGLPTALVRTGIHAAEPLDAVLAHCEDNDTVPDHILPALRL